MEIGTGIQKLMWVAAPLGLALLVLAVLAWRKRPPSRHGLNVAFSLLLLAYVLTTAGLGIFWVANQQLPVFDWHYLFGYTTVLLLVVHLAFNLRIVWQYLRRKAGAPASGRAAGLPVPAPAPTPVQRRGLLGIAGLGGLASLAAGAVLGYLLGLRHGRTELMLGRTGEAAAPAAEPAQPGEAGARTAAAAPAASPSEPANPSSASADAAAAWATVQQFHAHSGHSRMSVLRHAASTDWGLAPAPFKTYPDAERVALPPPGRRAGAAAAAAPDLFALAQWLWHTAGVSASRGGIGFRSSPSSGALFATELYVLPLAVHGLAPVWWHYRPDVRPDRHVLQRLSPQPGATPDANAAAAAATAALGALPPGALALVAASAIFARSGHKYGDRTYRYVLADLGHALENLRVAVSEASGLALRLFAHFDDAAIGSALGLPLRREAVLAVAVVMPPGNEAAPAAAAATAAWAAAPPPPWAGPQHRLGLTEAMQWATSLRARASWPNAHPGDSSPARRAAPLQAPGRPIAAASDVMSMPAAVAASASASRAVATRQADGSPPTQPLPARRGLEAPWLQVIARRRSVRRFAARPVPLQALTEILGAMAAPAAQLSAAVRIDLLSTALEGVPPAAWRVDPTSGALHRRATFASAAALRQRARAAALDQDVIGDAAVVFVLSLDRVALQADPAGPARGYRHGFIEAGLIGERLYLAAGALGLGVCAVGAFYDDEATALVGADPAREWVVHFAALGMPG